MKFVTSLPTDGRQKRAAVDLDALRQNRGQWAEIERLPAAERPKLAGRGTYLQRTQPDIRYTVRIVGDEAVLFLRAVAA